MYAFLLVLHLLICLGLIGVVLIQSGKGGGLAGGAFGGSAQTVFGGRGATDLITRATMILGGLFFVTSIVLALMTGGQRGAHKSIIQEEARKASSGPAQQAPALPTGGTAPAGSAPAGTAPARSAPAGATPATGTTPAPAPAPAKAPPAGGK